MNIDIKNVLETLCIDKTAKTASSLQVLNEIIKKYVADGGRDFSITTIGKLSAKYGGVGYQSIRKTSNKHFRSLIEAWAASCKTTTKKPSKTHTKTGKDYDLLPLIQDDALRTVFGYIIRERDRYKAEANFLKGMKEITIDMRPQSALGNHSSANVELIPSLVGLCTEPEIEALRYVASEDWLSKHKFTVTSRGAVIDEFEDEVMPNGFMLGLRKLLNDINE